MSTPTTYDPSLPKGADFGYSYEYGADIQLPGVGSEDPTWQAFRRATAIDPQVTAKTQDAATYDDRGSDNTPKVGETWTLNLQVQVQRIADTGLYLPEVEALMDLASPDAVGNKAIGTFRWYDKPRSGKPNPDDAFEGDGTVSIVRGQTGNDGIGTWTVTITGNGPRRQIDNPFGGWVGQDDDNDSGDDTGNGSGE